MLLKAIVVDDEKPSREALTTYLRDYCPDVEVVAGCDSVKSAYKDIQKHHPNLVFLDIEMPNGNGFDLLKLFKTIDFKVVFVTAYSEYAIRAFRFSATDYLLKPVKVDELAEAVNKVNKDLAHKKNNLNLHILEENLFSQDNNHHNLVIPDIHGFVVIRTKEIILCEAEGYCTTFFLSGNRKVTSSKNLRYYEDLLDKSGIIRAHRSFLVNLSKVTGYSRQGEIFLEENNTCPLGNNYRQQFMEKIGKHA